MDAARWFMLIALMLFLAEGFALAIFPRQFQQFLIEADPRSLQLAGLVETVLAVALMAGIVAG